MNAEPSCFLPPPKRLHSARVRKAGLERQFLDRQHDERRFDKFWQWFAVAVLAFAWIAEASMCAARGF